MSAGASSAVDFGIEVLPTPGVDVEIVVSGSVAGMAWSFTLASATGLGAALWTACVTGPAGTGLFIPAPLSGAACTLCFLTTLPVRFTVLWGSIAVCSCSFEASVGRVNRASKLEEAELALLMLVLFDLPREVVDAVVGPVLVADDFVRARPVLLEPARAALACVDVLGRSVAVVLAESVRTVLDLRDLAVSAASISCFFSWLSRLLEASVGINR